MLIEQIIAFELRRMGHLSCTYTPTTGYFHDKTKISKANFRVNDYLQLNISQKIMYLTSPQLGQVTHEI